MDELFSILGRDKTLCLHNTVEDASATTHFPNQGTLRAFSSGISRPEIKVLQSSPTKADIKNAWVYCRLFKFLLTSSGLVAKLNIGTNIF